MQNFGLAKFYTTFANKKTCDMIKAVVFDADDTLWDCQSHFVEVEEDYASLLAEYGVDKEKAKRRLFETECRNMPLLGFGVKAFTISLIENANAMTDGRIGGEGIRRILELGRSLLTLPATPLDGVVEVLESLSHRGGLKLAVFTKGELLDQHGKLERSGLSHYFDYVKVVNDKTPDAVRLLCRELGIEPEEMLMVGNSFKSDVIPAVETGAYAIHVPAKRIWQYEHVKAYAHPRVRTISNIRDLCRAVTCNGHNPQLQ